MDTESSQAAQSDLLKETIEMIVVSSRFARRATQQSHTGRSLVAWRTLGNLDFEGPQRVTELAAREKVGQSTMSEIVSNLEKDGLVTRTKDPADGRAFRIEITELGRSELHKNRAQAAQALQPALARLTAFDRAVLVRATELLDQITNAPENK